MKHDNACYRDSGLRIDLFLHGGPPLKHLHSLPCASVQSQPPLRADLQSELHVHQRGSVTISSLDQVPAAAGPFQGLLTIA